MPAVSHALVLLKSKISVIDEKRTDTLNNVLHFKLLNYFF